MKFNSELTKNADGRLLMLSCVLLFTIWIISIVNEVYSLGIPSWLADAGRWTSLVILSAGILSLLRFVSRDKVSMADRVETFLKTTNKNMAKFYDLGLVGVLDRHVLADRVFNLRSSSEITIKVTFLYSPHDNIPHLTKALESQSDAKLRIIFLEPTCDAALRRGEEIGDSKFGSSEHYAVVQRFLVELQKLKEKFPNRVSLLASHHNHHFPVYVVRDELKIYASVGWYLDTVSTYQFGLEFTGNSHPKPRSATAANDAAEENFARQLYRYVDREATILAGQNRSVDIDRLDDMIESINQMWANQPKKHRQSNRDDKEG